MKRGGAGSRILREGPGPHGVMAGGTECDQEASGMTDDTWLGRVVLGLDGFALTGVELVGGEDRREDRNEHQPRYLSVREGAVRAVDRPHGWRGRGPPAPRYQPWTRTDRCQHRPNIDPLPPVES